MAVRLEGDISRLYEDARIDFISATDNPDRHATVWLVFIGDPSCAPDQLYYQVEAHPGPTMRLEIPIPSRVHERDIRHLAGSIIRDGYKYLEFRYGLRLDGSRAYPVG